jgi:hypothetical protein
MTIQQDRPGRAASGLKDGAGAARRRFARAMTRSEFGRHYWDDDKEAERKADKPRRKEREAAR